MKYLRVISLVGCILTTFILKAQEGVVIDEIIAKVDNHIVLRSELELGYLDVIRQGQPAGEGTKCRVLEGLVVNKMLLAKAEIDSVVVLDIEVESSLDRKLRYIVAQIGSEEKLEEYYNKSIEEFKEELKEQEKDQLLIQRMQARITEDVEVTPAEIRKFFNQIPKDSLPYFSKEVAVGQIVKYAKAGTERKNQAIEKLKAIKQLILNGEDFNTLAKEFSHEPIAAETGGRLGWYRLGELAPEYEAMALSLSPGEISDPVESDFGIHLIQLLGRRGNEYDTQHILLIAQPSEKDIQKTINELDSIRNLIVNDSITFDKAAKEWSDDQVTAANGGFLMDETGAARISVEKLDPSTFFSLDTMKIGQISNPILYKTPDGKDAVRIIYYKSELKPHQANLEDDWQKIRAATLNRKKNQLLSKWFNSAKDEVFIEIDEQFDHCSILK